MTSPTALTRALVLPCALSVMVLSLWPLSAQILTVQELYADALAKERAVRVALADQAAIPTTIKAARTVVGDFEAIVRRYPTSGYGDDALWHGGQLSLDTFRKFGEEHEKATAARLLRALAAEYPTSRLASRVPAALAQIDVDVTLPAPVPALTPAPARVAPVSETSPRLATIKDIRRTVLPDAVRVTIELDSEVPFHDERLDNPARVFVDLPATRASAGFVDRTIRFEGDGDVVRQVRVGRRRCNRVRGFRRLGPRANAIDDEAIRAVKRVHAVARDAGDVEDHAGRTVRMSPHANLAHHVAITLEPNRAIDEAC